MNTKKCIIVMISMVYCLIFSTETLSENYYVNLTRRGNGLYKVDSANIYLKLRFCYKYVYFEEAIIRYESTYGYSKGSVIFLESQDDYDIEEIYEAITPAVGTMVLTAFGQVEEAELILIPTKLN